jgi:hypothetical protein
MRSIILYFPFLSNERALRLHRKARVFCFDNYLLVHQCLTAWMNARYRIMDHPIAKRIQSRQTDDKNPKAPRAPHTMTAMAMNNNI